MKQTELDRGVTPDTPKDEELLKRGDGALKMERCSRTSAPPLRPPPSSLTLGGPASLPPVLVLFLYPVLQEGERVRDEGG